MKYTLPELQDKTDIELIKLFRTETSEKQKSIIFNAIFFRKTKRDYSWDQIIRQKARNNKQKADYYNLGLDEDDIYQEITSAFIKALTRWFDVNSMVACDAYLWRVIDSYTNRLFQKQKTHKRSVCSNSIIKLDNMYDDSKTFDEVISTQNETGVFRTFQKTDSIEKELFYKDLLTFIKDIFKPLNIDASIELQKELLIIIRQEKSSENLLSHVAIKFGIDLEEAIKLKDKLNENLDRQMYCDIIKLMQKDIKDDGIVARKYACSNCHITKLKRKLGVIVKKKLKNVGVTLHDYL
jgi:hypothetical protein